VLDDQAILLLAKRSALLCKIKCRHSMEENNLSGFAGEDRQSCRFVSREAKGQEKPFTSL
jgi:hypothetical protein